MNKVKIHKCIVLFVGLALILIQSCTNQSEKKTVSEDEEINLIQTEISKADFLKVPDSAKPWVYYWWLKGNVSKELITRDLEEMKDKGIGGFLLFDSRGYHDGYEDGIVPVPLKIKYEFMSPEWREMVKHAMTEANRMGLKMSINLANTGGSLRGPWDMKENGPKQLIWTEAQIKGPQKFSVKLTYSAELEYFKDIAIIATEVTGNTDGFEEISVENLNRNWKEVIAPEPKASNAGSIIVLNDKIANGELQWDVPAGNWKILRFGYHVIGDKGSVDILNSEAVTHYFQLMGNELLKDAGPLAGVTLTRFYNVSWEGGQPNWTNSFENEFLKYRGYAMEPYLPVLAGMTVKDSAIGNRFMNDYLKTVSDCFKDNCYKTIGDLCHANGVEWHSENGGPWPRNAPMFEEADQLTFWGMNDMAQGEFWSSTMSDLMTKSNVRYTAMASHIYGHPLIAVEAFTHMEAHWTKYPAYLKPFADVNFIDGANFFIWHTFTASPFELGKPGFEYFAGTHLNPNITWWNEAGGFLNYLGRCQYLLRRGTSVVDACVYVSDKNYVKWGRGEKWNEKSELKLPKGYSYDLIDSEALVNRLSVENGQFVLPDGKKYQFLVVDLESTEIPGMVLDKIRKHAEDGGTIVLGACKPKHTPGLRDFPKSDIKITQTADELGGKDWTKIDSRSIGSGKVYNGTPIDKVLFDKHILPDVEGPIEYIHVKNESQDIYFITGEGKANCTFRISDKKPEIWDPVSGVVTDAIAYNFTNDGRTSLTLDLPENGSVFVIFREAAPRKHFISVNGPNNPVFSSGENNLTKVDFWKNGDYEFTISKNKIEKVPVTVTEPIELRDSWNVTFHSPFDETTNETNFNKLILWNESNDPVIKYFSGTAVYKLTFELSKEQASNLVRLQLGKVHDIARVFLNGKDLGVIWTAPWRVDLTSLVKEGTNVLEVAVTNCWSNRLIGDANLAPEKRSTNTNVRFVPNRDKYPEVYKAISATDPLMPSGLGGPVSIEFGKSVDIKL